MMERENTYIVQGYDPMAKIKANLRLTATGPTTMVVSLGPIDLIVDTESLEYGLRRAKQAAPEKEESDAGE